jgi:hypothetical protein
MKKNPPVLTDGPGAEDRARTGHPNLGKVMLYQMSYFRNFFYQHKKELKGCKNKQQALLKKILNPLFVFGSV